MAKILSGKYLKFSEMPKANEKEILEQAKKDGHLGVEVSSESIPPILRQLSISLIAFKTNIWKQAQSYFTECQTKITDAEVLHNINNVRPKLTNKTLLSDDLDLPKIKSSLSSDYHAFEIQRDNYEKFKKLHGLSLLPKNADPAETRLQKIFLIGLFILEFFLNLFMLQGGGAVDLPAAMSISIGQTTINIISCYLLGKILIGHLLHAQKTIKRLSLGLLMGLHIYAIAVLNANMGLFRNAITKNADAGGEFGGGGGIEILTNAALYPWDKMGGLDITAGIVVGVGLVLAVLAYLDGVKSDDLYPGYGDVYRGALKIKKKISLKVKSLNEGWNMCLKKFNTAKIEATNLGSESITIWSKETNTIEQVWSDYKKYINELEEIYGGALHLYASNYNKFSTGGKVQLKKELLDKDEFDLAKQFDDVAALHLNDITRIKIEKEKRIQFAKELPILLKELDLINEKITKEIQEISDKYKCKLS